MSNQRLTQMLLLWETSHLATVALAVNEVSVTYTVDNQQMEIGIKLPIGYPMKTVDVEPIRRVGSGESMEEVLCPPTSIFYGLS